MVTLIPSLDRLRHENITEGERQVAKVLTENLGNDCLIWFNPQIPPKNLEPDFLVLDPGRGLLILEVKDWRIETIVDADDFTVKLSLNNKLKSVKNPFKQVKSYSHEVQKSLVKGENLVYPDGARKGNLMFPYGAGVILTKITRAELKQHNLETFFGANSVFCQDEIFEYLDPELFQEKLWSLLRFSIAERLNGAQINSIYEVLQLSKKPLSEERKLPINIPDRDKPQTNINLNSLHKMIKGTAILIVNQQREKILQLNKTHFANINAAQNVWWFDIPPNRLENKNSDINLLMYDRNNTKLYHLEIPCNYFQDNYSSLYVRQDTNHSGAICLKLSADAHNRFQDVQHSHRMSFRKFLKGTYSTQQ